MRERRGKGGKEKREKKRVKENRTGRKRPIMEDNSGAKRRILVNGKASSVLVFKL